MRQPDVIMTNMASTLIQWVTRTQAGWMVAPAGDWAIAKSAEPIVMAHSYINSDGDRPHNRVSSDRWKNRRGVAPLGTRPRIIVSIRVNGFLLPLPLAGEGLGSGFS